MEGNMSIHIGAKKGEVAEKVLLPGDPLRAKYIAETFLDNPVCYNNVRGMLGYTGTYKGKRVSVQGTGMGIPSISIYAHELIQEYGCKTLIRVGSCGSLQESVKVRDVIIAMSASTDSNFNRLYFNGLDYASTANFELVSKAYSCAKDLNMPTWVGSVFTSDNFYADSPDGWQKMAKYGVLGIEMEAAALYTIASKLGVDALALLTVSDSMLTHETTSSEDREKTFNNMIEIALEIC